MRANAPGAAIVLWVLVVPAAIAGSAEPGAEVLVENYAFEPSAVTIAIDETVRWTLGRDPEQHTVTPVDPAAFEDSGPLFAGDTYEVTFVRPGTWAYLCTLHPTMTGSVSVTAAASPTPTQSAGAPPTARPEPAGTATPGTPATPADRPAGSPAVAPAVALGLVGAALAAAVLAAIAIRRRP